MWLPAMALLLLLAQADTLANPMADPMEEGRKALDANQFERAADLFRQVVSRDGSDYVGHFHLALAYSLLKDDAHAVAEYEQTLKLKPNLYQAELNLGISLLRQGRAANAVKPLESAVAQKPAELQPRVKLGAAYLATKQFTDAEKAYAAGVAAAPQSADAQLGLAKAIAAQGRLAEAAPSFERAAALDPGFRDALLELAGLYEQAKQPEKAARLYEKFPENAAAQERLGELLLEQKRFAEALPRLEQAVSKSPTAANRLALATAYRMNKQPDREEATLAQAVSAEPGDYDLHMVFGRSLRDRRKFTPAAQQFYAAAQKRPDSVEAWNEMAAVLIIAEDYPRGLAALDKVKALGKESAGNLFLRAITLDRLKQQKPALESYQQFLAASNGKNPDQEFEARQRARILRLDLSKK